jgi:signal transduction histidine kinase
MGDAKDAFSALAAEKKVSLSIAGQEFNGSGVFDPDKLRRVLDNLIGNALKFTPAGGHVDVAFSRDGEHLNCEVRDTGRGMEPDVLERIFDRFYTSSRSTGNPDGTGLGLHIVKRIVEMHGGKIVASSKPNEGTTFHFHVNAIPRAPKEPTRKDTAADAFHPDESAVFAPGPLARDAAH